MARSSLPGHVHVVVLEGPGAARRRIGYVAVRPERPDAAQLVSAFTFTNRILGFVDAPALQQRLVEDFST
ncbi:MAG: hypothetical protein H6806_03830 [Planctomycetes bacterium]|nr:hypothetical protein [Planctomycetota bacterium]